MMNSKSTTKRGRDTDNDSDGLDEVDASTFAQMTRSQRKCHRERKRRSEVNKGFDDLTSLLWEIDAETMRAEVESRAQRGKKASNFPSEEIVLSRVDLINLTISLLRRLNNENEQRKDVIATLTRPGSIAGGDLNTGNIASSQPRQSSAEALGATSQRISAFDRDPMLFPTRSTDPNHLHQQRLVMEHLANSQPAAYADGQARSMNILGLYSQNLRNQQDEKPSYRNDNASVGSDTRLNVLGLGSADVGRQTAQLPFIAGSSDLIATFLARQQQARQLSTSNVDSNRTNQVLPLSRTSASTDYSLRPLDTTSDLTRQLLDLIHNRRGDSSTGNTQSNMNQIEEFLQSRQQTHQKPPGPY